ncbi:hypothetical protein BY996DRAFT_3986822 [Phakopsora pachyrhizi]|nr:hypothetical protein BY996DRAFT_3986822 [Phakopsora pachyrhizi]
MPLSIETLRYIHLHRLTRDLEWTLESAADLIEQVSVPFSIAPLSDTPAKDLNLALVCTKTFDEPQTHLGQAVISDLPYPDVWQITPSQVSTLNQFKRSQREANKLSVVSDDRWWDGGFFEQRIVPIMGDFLLSRRSLTQERPKKNPANDSEVRGIIHSHGQDLLKLTTIPTANIDLKIRTQEELSDTSIIILPEQLRKMRNAQSSIALTLHSTGDRALGSRLLNGQENVSQFFLENFRHQISPPLIPRKLNKGFDSSSNLSKKTMDFVRGFMKQEPVVECSPILSSEEWNALDITSPATPASSVEVKVIKPMNELLSSLFSEEKNETIFVSRAHLEPVLLPRTQGGIINRSKSFNPANYLDLKPLLRRKRSHSGNLNTPGELIGNQKEIEEEISVLNWDDFLKDREFNEEAFQENLLGGSFDFLNNLTKLRKLPVNTPKTPPSKERGHIEFHPSNVKDFTLNNKENSNAHDNSSNLKFQKVQGLSSLNIELPWSAYSFPSNFTIEDLTGIDFFKEKSYKQSFETMVESKNSFISNRLKSEKTDFQKEGRNWPNLVDLMNENRSRSNLSNKTLEPVNSDRITIGTPLKSGGSQLSIRSISKAALSLTEILEVEEAMNNDLNESEANYKVKKNEKQNFKKSSFEAEVSDQSCVKRNRSDCPASSEGFSKNHSGQKTVKKRKSTSPLEYLHSQNSNTMIKKQNSVKNRALEDDETETIKECELEGTGSTTQEESLSIIASSSKSLKDSEEDKYLVKEMIEESEGEELGYDRETVAEALSKFLVSRGKNKIN